jgi:[acyl-carrier-protein] S-malonyltransferase
VDALADAIEAVSAAGGKSRRLGVSAAFHSPVMAPAAERVQAALSGVPISTPAFELWSPTMGTPVRAPDEIRRILVDQLTSPVRWRETIEGLAQAHGSVFRDLGPGKVVAGLTKRIVGGADIKTIEDMFVSAQKPEGAA